MRIQTLSLLGAVALGSLSSAQSVGVNYCGPAVPNSTGVPGAISGMGSDVAGGNPLTLTASDLPLNQFGYFLVSETQAFVPNPGVSQGNLCLGGTIGRYNAMVGNSGATGEISLAIDTLALPLNPSTAVQAGETWNFQLWYRDLNPQATSNFTDGLAITFTGGGGLDADFTSDVQTGGTDLTVNFMDLSTGGASAWMWDFGDGNTSSMQNPSHVYTDRGTYNVSLTVNGSDTETKTSFIVALQGFGDVWDDFNKNALVGGMPNGDKCIDCHGSNGFAGFDMPNQATAYAEMINILSTCDGTTPRIDPGNPANSLVYTKIEGTQNCGSSMPLGQDYPGDLQVLENWILDGAVQ